MFRSFTRNPNFNHHNWTSIQPHASSRQQHMGHVLLACWWLICWQWICNILELLAEGFINTEKDKDCTRSCIIIWISRPKDFLNIVWFITSGFIQKGTYWFGLWYKLYIIMQPLSLNGGKFVLWRQVIYTFSRFEAYWLLFRNISFSLGILKISSVMFKFVCVNISPSSLGFISSIPHHLSSDTCSQIFQKNMETVSILLRRPTPPLIR